MHGLRSIRVASGSVTSRRRNASWTRWSRAEAAGNPNPPASCTGVRSLGGSVNARRFPCVSSRMRWITRWSTEPLISPPSGLLAWRSLNPRTTISAQKVLGHRESHPPRRRWRSALPRDGGPRTRPPGAKRDPAIGHRPRCIPMVR